jgi:acyl CoA:acetate/3-ketoacid CoA transferase alpha subunit
MADRKITALTALTSPATGDLFPVVDVSEAANANKNKSITFGTLFRTLPNGSVGAPSIGFLSDSGTSGIFRSDANEVAFSNNSTFTGKFTTAGFQLGTGTAAAQLHLFSTDTTDQVIIENSDAGLDTAPDVVLYRNSASPAASDNLGNIEFRGNDSAGNTHGYASVVGGIVSTTNGSEDGFLDLMSSASGTLASKIRLSGANVGVNHTAPSFPLHLLNTIASTQLMIESSANDPSSAADITLFHRRGASGAGQDDDVLSTVFIRGKNDNATPQEIDYAAFEGSIADASDTTEDGRIRLKTTTAGTLTTQLEINANTIGFFGATAAAQSTHVADITTTASSGALPAANDTNTIADATAPTNAELLQYCVTLEAKVEALLAFASAHGLMASS